MPVLIYLSIWVVIAGSWFTHIFRCFSHGDWGFLIGGALFFPIAVVHGIGIWFGAW